MPHALRYILGLAGFSIALLFLIDAGLFRSGMYMPILEPGSYAGQFLAALRRAQVGSGSKRVLILGDSRINEGFSAKIGDQESPGIRFFNAAVPGASLRSWYYILREADPGRDKYTAVILPVDDYDDEDGPADRDDELTDLRIIAPALQLTDVSEFGFSYRKWAARCEVLRKAVFKGLIYRDDLRVFLRDPAARIASAGSFAAHGREWQYDYEGAVTSLAGLAFNPLTGALEIPASVAPPVRLQLEAVYRRPYSPQTGNYKRYRQYWIGRILRAYQSRNTKFIIIRLPRNPLPAPHYAHYDANSSIRSLRHIPGVVIEEENTFQYLESPGYFSDALHLNAEGRKLFSAALARLTVEEISRR